jgi:NADH-quinone oxidoreductase subunit J
LLYNNSTIIALYVLFALTIFFALLTVEFKSIIRAILSFAAMSILIGGIFWLLGSMLVAFFQILVYAGAVVVLFLITTMLVESR